MTQDLELKIDALNQKLDRLLAKEAAREELLDEALLISKSFTQHASTQLAELEDKGYFAFAKELSQVADRVVTGFSPEDVRTLSDNIVRILSTVRALTQPKMLGILTRASEAVEHEARPRSLLGTLKATRDKDVQRGMAVVMEILRQVGQVSASASLQQAGKQDRLRARLAPSRSASPEKALPKPKTPVAPPPPTETPSPDTPWSREWAETRAQALGLPPLTAAHWQILDFMRTAHAQTHKTPNLRAISVETGVSMRDIYQLFPGAPGKVAAELAGVPKPAGCI